ncbi:glycoside hydrolase family 57 protein [Bacteroides sp. 224]|uniref:glycoside hydrolase family 57 protein n=1 Tax=Bacteroides sp. 224 TaxID=2302936 RepID=UPI0013D51FC7|nr:glycoside hydrolase family 57 protein [Bacteroides sp. 224]NDV64949.1 alpha-amylase [Bacteroides sp. 224]
MRTICFYFEIHQSVLLKRYRFFDIGVDHYYNDDYASEALINQIAERSYIPALNTLLEMINNSGGAFKVALSVSGIALEQLEIHAPAVVDLLHQLNNTGCCEFLGETYSHSLSSLENEDCFKDEVKRHSAKMKMLFGKTPKVFRNSNLLYSDDIGATVSSLGFKGMLAEGAKQVLGWKSPHYVYHCNQAPSLKVLLRDYKLSDDISLRFSDSDWSGYPLFADKYMDWVAAYPQEEQVINIFMELSALGYVQPLSSNILEFMKALPACAKDRGITFSTPTEVISKLKSVSQIDIPYPVSWADEERDVSSWLGNVLQREAFNKLYSVAERVLLTTDRRIKQDWDYLQASNNFRFMTTKNTGVAIWRGNYDSPYDAFTNYMNILGDFIKRVNSLYPEDMDNEELNSLLTTIKNQDEEITRLEGELEKAKAKLEKASAKTPAKAKKTTKKETTK